MAVYMGIIKPSGPTFRRRNERHGCAHMRHAAPGQLQVPLVPHGGSGSVGGGIPNRHGFLNQALMLCAWCFEIMST
jgi:hypothetical protein